MVAAARGYFFDNPLKGFAASFFLNAFPLDRDTNVREGLYAIGKLLDNEWTVLLYPEGTRSTDGTMNHFKNGIGILAQEMDVPIIPMHITGTFDMLPKGKTHIQKGDVHLVIGKPIISPKGVSYIETTNMLENVVASLR